MDAGLFTNFSTTVSGTISDGGHAVWVNGKKATMHDDHTWSASGVPVNQGGTATLHVRAIANSDNGGNGTPPPENQALGQGGSVITIDTRQGFLAGCQPCRASYESSILGPFTI